MGCIKGHAEVPIPPPVSAMLMLATSASGGEATAEADREAGELWREATGSRTLRLEAAAKVPGTVAAVWRADGRVSLAASPYLPPPPPAIFRVAHAKKKATLLRLYLVAEGDKARAAEMMLAVAAKRLEDALVVARRPGSAERERKTAAVVQAEYEQAEAEHKARLHEARGLHAVPDLVACLARHSRCCRLPAGFPCLCCCTVPAMPLRFMALMALTAAAGRGGPACGPARHERVH